MESFGKFWNVVLAFLLLFICPVYLNQIRRDMIHDISLIKETDQFLDQIKYRGYIDKRLLNNFVEKITEISNGRRVKILHQRRAVVPIYKDGEIVETREFYLDINYEEIKEKIKKGSKYLFFIGDKIRVEIVDCSSNFPFLIHPKIEMGGMIENEFGEG